jgi:hypothetical protein
MKELDELFNLVKGGPGSGRRGGKSKKKKVSMAGERKKFKKILEGRAKKDPLGEHYMTEAEYKKYQEKSMGEDMDKFDKLLKGMGARVGEGHDLIKRTDDTTFKAENTNASTSRVGTTESPRERLFRSMGVRETDVQKVQKAYGDEYIKDQHAESWHMDNDKLVHTMSTTAGKVDTYEESHDQDSQKEAASVVAAKPAKKEIAVTPATKSEADDKENRFEKARALLSEDELFAKAMGAMDEDDDEDDDGEEKEVTAESEAAAEEKKNAPKGSGEAFGGKKSESFEIDLEKGYGMMGEKPSKSQIGRTGSGKDIMDSADHKAHKDFEHDDHEDAFRAHSMKMREHKDHMYSLMDGEHSASKRKMQGKLKERCNEHDEQRVKHLQKIYKSVDCKLVEKLEKACAYGSSDLKKKKMKRDAAKMESLHENSPAVAEKVKKMEYKSELDSLLDLVKAGPAKKDAPVQRRAPVQRSLTERGFVKAAGKGGVVMEFGNKTGNPHADRFTELLDSHGDNTQKEIAKYQNNQYEKALTSFVTQGEDTYMSKSTGKGVDLDTPMDKQVANEFAKGQLDVQEKRMQFSEKSLNVGGESVQAASETDAALIEMMNAEGQDLSGITDGPVIDATGSAEVMDLTA